MPMIRLMIYQKGGTNEDARDIFQDGLIIMLEKLDDKNLTLPANSRHSSIVYVSISGKLPSINVRLQLITLIGEVSRKVRKILRI